MLRVVTAQPSKQTNAHTKEFETRARSAPNILRYETNKHAHNQNSSRVLLWCLEPKISLILIINFYYITNKL
jgi:hypothetical protein